MFVHCPNKATCGGQTVRFLIFVNVWMPRIWFKDLYSPLLHFIEWLSGTPIRTQLLFFFVQPQFIPQFIICCQGNLPASYQIGGHKSIPRRTCTPGEDRVIKGRDKLALGGNAKQRFWQQATWNPCKTAMRFSLATWFRWPRTGEEKKAERHINTINPRWVMSWKN